MVGWNKRVDLKIHSIFFFFFTEQKRKIGDWNKRTGWNKQTGWKKWKIVV